LPSGARAFPLLRLVGCGRLLVRAANDLAGSTNKPAAKVYGTYRPAVLLRGGLLKLGCHMADATRATSARPVATPNRRFSPPALQMPPAA